MSTITRPRFAVSFMLAALLAASATTGCQAKFKKAEGGEVDQAQKASAEKFATDTLTAWAKNTYPKVTIAADPKFKEAQDDETKQKAADKSIEGSMGDFQSLTYYETQKSDPPDMVLHRFKGKFSKSEAPAEVRVVFDKSGNLAGFWIKPWKDSL